jgi:hypothetical protein
MVVHTNKGASTDNENDAGSNEHISINKPISLTEELTKELEQKVSLLSNMLCGYIKYKS